LIALGASPHSPRPAKAAKGRRAKRKTFGKLPISTVGKTAAEFVRHNSGFDLTAGRLQVTR
jgi:hypothetical protein